MEKEKEMPPAERNVFSETENVKLTLQPMHDEKKEGEVLLAQDEAARRTELPPSDEQKAKEAEALAKVLLLQQESEREKSFPGLMIPWKLSLALLFIILFFAVLHFAFSLFAPKGAVLERVKAGTGENVENTRK